MKSFLYSFRKETKMVKHTSFYRAINCAFYHSALAIISLVVFTVYVMTGHILTAERVFVVLGLLMAVRVCFTLFFSLGVMYLKESAVSEKRVQVKCHYLCIHIGYIYMHDVKNKDQKAKPWQKSLCCFAGKTEIA